jgi:hypothetical protein
MTNAHRGRNRMTGNDDFEIEENEPQATPEGMDAQQGHGESALEAAPTPEAAPASDMASAPQGDLPWARRSPEDPGEEMLYSRNPSRAPYVRQRAPHKTQEAIDDLGDGGGTERYTHDSNIAVSGGAFSGGHAYRKARSSRSSMQGGQYGQYLEVPKGRRSIFESREKARRRRSIAALAAIILVLGLIVIFIVHLVTR